MSAPEDRYLPADVAQQILDGLLERFRTGALELAAELAPLARRDLEAFERAWCEAIERIAADALEHTLAATDRWAAPGRQWTTEQ